MAVNSNETSVLTRILQARTKDELQEIGEFFGDMLRKTDKKATIVHRLEMAFRTEMLRCLKCLPIYELRNLQLFVSQGKGVKQLIPEPLPPFFTYMFGLLEDDYVPGDYDSNWDNLMRVFLEDEIFDLIAPVIDTAIKEVEDTGRVEFERFLWGCLTVYGFLSMGEFIDLRRQFYPDEDLKAFFSFLDTYAPLPYLTDEYYEFLMYPDLDRIELLAEQESRGYYGRKLAQVPLEDILSAGKTTPYNFPFISHKEGRALANALKAVGHGGDAGALRMHWIWWEKQNEGGNTQSFKDLIQRILNDVRVDSFDSVQKLIGAITDYSNAIPTWVFRGRSSNDVLKEERPFLKPPVSGSRTAAVPQQGLFPGFDSGFAPGFGPVPRVGRNDPCPCGSGLKYKNCHGKWES